MVLFNIMCGVSTKAFQILNILIRPYGHRTKIRKRALATLIPSICICMSNLYKLMQSFVRSLRMQLRHLLTLRDHPEASNPGDEQNAPPLMAKDLVVSYPHHRTPVQTLLLTKEYISLLYNKFSAN